MTPEDQRTTDLEAFEKELTLPELCDLEERNLGSSTLRDFDM